MGDVICWLWTHLCHNWKHMDYPCCCNDEERMQKGLDSELELEPQDAVDWFQSCSLDSEESHAAAAAWEAHMLDALRWWGNHLALNLPLAWTYHVSLLLHIVAADRLLDIENLQRENRHRFEWLDLLPIDSQVPCIPALHACVRFCTNWALHLHHWPVLWGIKMEDDGLCIEYIDVSHLASDACKHACVRISDDCSCHSMRNTIEDPCMSCDQDLRSSRSSACTVAAAPFQHGHSSQLDSLPWMQSLDTNAPC